MVNDNHLNIFFYLCGLFLLSSCGHQTYPGNGSRSESNFEQAAYQTTPTLKQSLFNTKDRTISEIGIQQILNSKIVLPDTIRIALLNYSPNSISRHYDAYWNNEAYLKLQQAYIDVIKTQLKVVPSVKKIILMPKLMLEDNPTIFTLRESAVRLQADLLFIFSINSDIYQKYKVFKKDDIKAYATCESLLMDIRTGIIPHSEVVTKDFLTQKLEEDAGNNDLKKRAEQAAILLTLEEIGEKLTNFLKK